MQDFILEKLIEESPVAYCKLKREDKKIYLIGCNKSFLKMFNTKREKIDFLDVSYFFDEKSFENLDIVKKEKKRIVSRYVEQFNSYLNCEIYYIENNEYYISINRIDKDKRYLSDLIRKSPFMSWIKHRNGKYIDVNEKFLNFYNLKYNEIIGNTDEDMWSKEKFTKFKDKDNEVLSSNKLCVYNDYISLDGINRKHFEIAKWPYTDEDGKVIIGTMGIALEITNKLELKKSIEENERNFRDISEYLDEVLMIVEKDKAVYISESFEEMFGYSRDKLYEDLSYWYNYWDSVEYIKGPFTFDYKGKDLSVVKLKRGYKEICVETRMIPILDENGNVVRKIGLTRDITEKKKIEEEIEDLRMDFFANLSHEFRTPINLIVSSLQVILPKVETLEEEDKEFFKKFLNIIDQNGMRLLKLVNNLIDTTKIDSGNFKYNPINYDLISFVENICQSVVQFVNKNNLEIVFDTNEEECIVSFDLDHMERIILNLISNAIKFNKPNGKIELNIDVNHKNIEISVKDEGRGIPKDKVESIFKRFEQVNSKMKNEQEGSGIGLSLVKSLVDMHGGTISVNSKIGIGSEFIITIPNIQLDKVISQNVESDDLGKVNRMSVEFSDIYY